jgi:hypothetical protein
VGRICRGLLHHCPGGVALSPAPRPQGVKLLRCHHRRGRRIGGDQHERHYGTNKFVRFVLFGYGWRPRVSGSHHFRTSGNRVGGNFNAEGGWGGGGGVARLARPATRKAAATLPSSISQRPCGQCAAEVISAAGELHVRQPARLQAPPTPPSFHPGLADQLLPSPLLLNRHENGYVNASGDPPSPAAVTTRSFPPHSNCRRAARRRA